MTARSAPVPWASCSATRNVSPARLWNRIDIHLDVQRVPFEKLSSLDGDEPSSAIRARVEASRTVQTERFEPLGKPYVLVNGDMGPASAAFEQRQIE